MRFAKWKHRTADNQAPYIALGPFQLRLPFIHYRFEVADYIQGLLMCAVDLAAIPLLTQLLGMPFDVALAVVMLNGFFYLIHHLLGDPCVPGWITPAIPLILLYCQQFPEGAARIHSLIAFQMTLGVICIFLGVTGLAASLIRLIPSAIKCGIVMGAGLAAIISIFKAGGRFETFPITITIAVGIAFYLLFSRHFALLQQKNRLFGIIAKLGIFPIILLAIVITPLAGEANWPSIKWGFSTPDFTKLWQEYTVFGLGMPPLMMFITAIPTVLAAYIVLFGDILQNKALLADAAKYRPDEKVEYESKRAHMIFGGRNAFMSILGPDVTMCGPIWSAMQVVTIERWKKGRQAMDSFFGGIGSFRWGTNTGLLLMPIISFVEPILGTALALTLLIQGYVNVKIGVLEAKSQTDLGIAGVVAAILCVKGAAWAFMAGILLCLLIFGKDFFKNSIDYTFSKDRIKTDNHGE